MSNIDKRALRHSAESIIGILENIAGFEPSDIDGDSVELRFETEDGFDTGCDVSIVDQCQKTADVVRAMLDELERNQQYIKRRDQENEDIALTVGKLRVELEAANKRIAELEAEPVSQTCKLNEPSGNSPVTPDGWISCSERMPEIRQTVIGWNGYAVRQCVYTRNEYAKTQKGREPRFETLTGIWHGVTHWIPLPEPPQEVN
ncbi:TPA: ead/Ea22-like family protein [Escherichia coli]|nr:ead/Ea22-like family protein [Escherichia coli]